MKHSWQTTNKQYFSKCTTEKSYPCSRMINSNKGAKKMIRKSNFYACTHCTHKHTYINTHTYSTYIRWTDEKSQRIVSALYTQNSIRFVYSAFSWASELTFFYTKPQCHRFNFTDWLQFDRIHYCHTRCMHFVSYFSMRYTYNATENTKKQFKRR